MTDSPNNLNNWDALNTWETLILDTNQTYPEIGLLTLNRPDKLNAVNEAMVADLHDCQKFLSREFDIRVLIIRGAGRLFCAGVDLTSGLNFDEDTYNWLKFPDKVKALWQFQHEIGATISGFRKIPQPVIAAVHGAAVGDGMAMANAADIVVATRKSRFINAFIKIGLSGADCGSSYFLPRILGFHRAAELLYSGRDFGAEEAHEWGYVNFLVDNDEDALPRAVEFAAESMLTKSPLGLRLTKEALNFNMDAGDIDAAIKFEDRNQVVCAQTADSPEGIMSFFEKRRPKYGPR